MIPIILSLIVCFLAYAFVRVHGKFPSWRTIKLFNQLPGPKDVFFFGPVFKLMKFKMEVNRMRHQGARFQLLGNVVNPKLRQSLTARSTLYMTNLLHKYLPSELKDPANHKRCSDKKKILSWLIVSGPEVVLAFFKNVLPWVQELFEKYDWTWGCWFMGQPGYFVADPDVAEVIFTSTINIDKGADYDFLRRWLRDGLIFSSGDKWRSRRKMLTPSFHFKILENNFDCMNRNWKKVVQRFLEANGEPFEPLPIMGRGALAIICETAMGIELNDDDECCKEYITGVKRALEDASKRAMNPFLRSDFVYDLTPGSRRHMKDVKALHSFTEKVIQERRADFAKQKELEATECSQTEGKKSQVFLDSLLHLSSEENLSDEDIREEVDTFMFGGHDTTSTALQYLLMHIAENSDVQEKLYREQLEIFGYSDRDVTKDDLSKMRYLEQAIKESLRLNPSVPGILRQIIEDIPLPNGLIIPAGTKTQLSIYFLHRNPKHWTDPNTFRPERFSSEESKNRHPYSYVPFSAGPRNCIGQKFAMLEMKIGASIILRFCKMSPAMKSSDLKYKMMVVLEPSEPIKVKVEPRN